jgi:hypothetical protein
MFYCRLIYHGDRLNLRNRNRFRFRFLDDNRLRFLNLYRFRSWCRRDVNDNRRGFINYRRDIICV